MMIKKFLKISQLQIEGLEDPIENSKLIKKNLLKTITFKPDIISTPECSNTITNDKKHLIENATYQNACPVLKECKEFAKKYNKVIHIGSLLLKKNHSNKLVNRSFIIGGDGKIKKYYDKMHLFDVNINKKEIHRESESFIRGYKISTTTLFEIKIGLTICYDLRFPNLFRLLTKNGAKIIFVPAAFTIPTGKAHWEILLKARAIENTVFIIATGQCGHHHYKRKTYGNSLVVNPWGKILNQAKSFPKILNTTINLSEVEDTRSRMPSIYHD